MPTRATFPFALLIAPAALFGASAPLTADLLLEKQFTATVHPLVQNYCLGCHGPEKQEADLDLSPFNSLNAVVNGYSYWELVLERLEAGDMPPEKAKKHPSAEQRQAIVDWIHAVRKSEADKNAGDPGPVLARRLSNAEYDYSIRDLTGADIRPTKEFPVDPANQAGFDNSGESLTMSPALLKKYLQAARTVSEHLVLKPEGFEFAPHPVMADTDRDKYSVLKIVDFYRRQPTDYADYFQAAWRYQHRAALGQPRASLAEIAAARKVSPRYLDRIWAALTAQKEEIGPLAKLQDMWRKLPAPGADEKIVRDGCEQMRDFVTGLREKIVPEVRNLTAQGIERGSQTLVLWKNRQMAANRRKFDPAALQIDGVVPEPPPPETRPRNNAPQAPTYEAPKPPAPAVTAAPDATPAPRTPDAAAAIQSVVAQLPAEQSPAAASPSSAAAPRPAPPPNTPDVIRTGGKFLAPAITTTGSSLTSKMAARKRGADPDLFVPSAEKARYEAAFARFADVFPDNFYITERARVYLDAEREQRNAGRLLSAGLHSMTGYFRDDGPLYDLILDDASRQELDRLWREFDYYAKIPVRMHTSFVWFERTDSSFMRDAEFDPFRPEDKSVTTQEKIQRLGELYLAKAQRNNASEQVQTAIKEHFALVAKNMRWLEDTEAASIPTHLAALEKFAERAYRRPLSPAERAGLKKFYQASREENGVDHEDAMRDCIARVLMSPHFCYRVDLVEAAGDDNRTSRHDAARGNVVLASASAPTAIAPARNTRPLSDYALASRLSYFLWSSLPDDELLTKAAAGELRRPEVLAAQARRMLKDERTRNFATEFAGHWLDFRRFEEHNAVDRERFPFFDSDLRLAMFEEPLRFFTDVINADRSVLSFLYADHTFVNAPLARHYGMPDVKPEAGWVRVEGAGQYERGGLLPMAVFLTANSPGLRTSPVKRGYWVVRRVLGERIPPPPAVVPDLPNDEKNLGDLTLREVLAKHREDKSCASCHARFDSFGLVFEGFGPVGEKRLKDFGGRPVDTRAEFPGGKEAAGLRGLREYIRTHREKDFVDNLCRKLVAYALGRTLIPSDAALVDEMKTRLANSDHRFSALIETIVTSPQFRTKRAPTPEPPKTASLP